MKCRNILEVLQNSLEDRPKHKCRDMAEAEVRYKLIIDPRPSTALAVTEGLGTRLLVSLTNCVGGEKCFSPPTQPGYEVSQY